MANSDDFLSVKHLCLTYPESGRSKQCFDVVKDFSFTQKKGAFVAIVGSSGCGKTTLLKIIGGLLPASSGEVRLKGCAVQRPPSVSAFVFQDYSKSLLPWRTVRQNVMLGTANMQARNIAYDDNVSKFINMVGLTPFANHYPWQLSGGMQQRVAFARALSGHPEMLLMDEPFGSLDALTKSKLEDDLLAIWSELRTAVILVTHDIGEAIYLADRVIVTTGPPVNILADIPVDLPRPREQIATRSDPRFLQIWGDIFRILSSN